MHAAACEPATEDCVRAGRTLSAPLRNDVSSVAGSHAAACNYFSAAICPCAVSIEAPAAPSDHKAAVRQLAGARVACDAAFGLRTAMRTYSPALHPDAVDYYVFSLGRILI